MDQDRHGSGLAMMLLTLGFLVVLYSATLVLAENDVFMGGNPFDIVFGMSALSVTWFLVGIRLHR